MSCNRQFLKMCVVTARKVTLIRTRFFDRALIVYISNVGNSCLFLYIKALSPDQLNDAIFPIKCIKNHKTNITISNCKQEYFH